MTFVKICGITNLEDARLAIDFGADAVGFNFFPGSKRYIDESYAESIIERLQHPITKVGVFVNQSVGEIFEAQRMAKLDVVQLHGDESPNFVASLRSASDSNIIKAFRVSEEFDQSIIGQYEVDAILLDTFSSSVHGGTGKVFDWSIAASIASKTNQLYLAGGLNADNVAEAIRTVKPYAVDVASGVESSPGKKDHKKVAAFIKAAKEAI